MTDVHPAPPYGPPPESSPPADKPQPPVAPPAAPSAPVDNATYTRRNALILLGILAIPTLLALALITYYSGARSHLTLDGESIWDSSLLTDSGLANAKTTWLDVTDTQAIETGALAEHLAEAVPHLGGTSGIFRREATHSTTIYLPDGGYIDIASHEDMPISLSTQSWQNLLLRASDERLQSVTVSAHGAGYYGDDSPWVEVRYYLYGEQGDDRQDLLTEMAEWEPVGPVDVESVSYMYDLDLDSQEVQIFALGPLSEVQAWSRSATPIAQVFAEHTEGLQVVSVNKYRDATDYFVSARFEGYTGDADAARQAMVAGVQGTEVSRVLGMDLTDATGSAYYFEGQWEVTP
ncbi:hypothetical protein [Rothia nasimurium]|uniref:hypothetical protein n=1 Tax=Rothia nasimurium TaxID=85336 RepID=UPI001F1678BD|nr:hypothetical protein [Rothia nasimurium]